MLPKINRLKKGEFAKIFKKGKRYYSKYFTVFYFKDSSHSLPKVGVIAGLKVGNAVERNRAKRILRHTLKEKIADFPPYSIIVSAKSNILDLQHDELRREIDIALKAIFN